MKLRGAEKLEYVANAVAILCEAHKDGRLFISWGSLGRSVAQGDAGHAPEYRVDDEAKRCMELRHVILREYHHSSKNHAAQLGFPEKRRKVPGRKDHALHGGPKITEGIWLSPPTEAVEKLIISRGRKVRTEVIGMNNTADSAGIDRQLIRSTIGGDLAQAPQLPGHPDELEQ